jgi:hypothetical protein
MDDIAPLTTANALSLANLDDAQRSAVMHGEGPS